jgi:predicted nucleic acid-binding protein
MVSQVVIDNSVLMPLIFEDESRTASDELLLVGASTVKLLCPKLCISEFGNGILSGIRRRRLTVEQAEAGLAVMDSFPLNFREGVTLANFRSIGQLAVKRELSFYDAVYLALALDESAVLATLDRRLSAAAQAEGVPLWSWTGK